MLKSQFLDKINKRIRTMVKEFGIDKSDITDLINMDGVYTTKSGYLGIDKNFWTPELAKAIEDLVPTMQQEKADAIERLANSEVDSEFIGPIPKKPTKGMIAREVQAKYSVESAWEDIREKYYESEELLKSVDSEIIDKLGNYGMDFYKGDVSYTDLVNFRESILEEIEAEKNKYKED